MKETRLSMTVALQLDRGTGGAGGGRQRLMIFIGTRLLHLIWMFNCGRKGILDITQKRLFNRKTFRKRFDQNGFEVLSVKPVQGPWGLMFGRGGFDRTVTAINARLCRILLSLFASSSSSKRVQARIWIICCAGPTLNSRSARRRPPRPGLPAGSPMAAIADAIPC
jgi:hypothetical protein